MKDLSEFEFYDSNIQNLVDDETWDFYHDELVEIRKQTTGIVIAWVVPDQDVGHVEYKTFNTWTDAELWTRQE